MKKLRGLLKASHFGPTLIVTSISWFFAAHYWWEGPAYVIAFGVFTGQLVVGWSNDLYDYKDDLMHNRQNKPLVSELISQSYLKRWLTFMVPFSFVANLLGPLGFKGGLVYMFGISMGVAYNFYFKFNVFSWFPYALAFAALPSCIAISKDVTPPVWMWLGGALLGSAAHFINVIKDMDQDRASGIGGAPQRIGKRNSIVVAGLLIALGLSTLVVFN
ncbi:UbiA prenyltransferase family protein [Candidatus Planktophila lacus]|uniref:UbiA family prenyltransferase n=1 Tax=Candidatus Planktophila lacus TaxID=1884913 RepID=UPI000BAC7458|nr:UbiA family prenyltransferase [Candidatus Planktophila lacus]ASY24892.1 UbiA prenyltransferase family protein [Candidatus Planktophila lacus]ASY28845.1 UbiA prenyltransferase family protein [Candidatus Planktophila lacus]